MLRGCEVVFNDFNELFQVRVGLTFLNKSEQKLTFWSLDGGSECWEL